jgi:hypothetical protein
VCWEGLAGAGGSACRSPRLRLQLQLWRWLWLWLQLDSSPVRPERLLVSRGCVRGNGRVGMAAVVGEGGGAG